MPQVDLTGLIDKVANLVVVHDKAVVEEAAAIAVLAQDLANQLQAVADAGAGAEHQAIIDSVKASIDEKIMKLKGEKP